MMPSTIEAATGRWREILPRLGVDARFLTNRQGPCPICSGKTRFRFDDKNGEGTYYCNRCGAGVGIILLRKLHNWDHATACHEVDKIIGRLPQPPATPSTTRTPPKSPAMGSGRAKPVAPADVAERRLKAIERLLDDARDPDIVADYLTSRGIVARSPVLRGHRRCPYFNDGEFVGNFPAVIAPIVGSGGNLHGAMRIYVTDLEPRKKVMPAAVTGPGAVRLHDADRILGIAEGIETALAAHVLFHVPVWAAVSAYGIENFDAPGGLQRLHIFADNDRNHVGQASAHLLARRLGRDRPEIVTQVHVPTTEGADYNDVLRAQRGVS
jgi:putative DNA primase/helicase